MIATANAKITYDYMGIFTGDANWVHPKTRTATYELIFVHEGRVFIEEADRRYALSRGDYLLLSPSVLHGGYRESGERTVFTWIHFFGENFEMLEIPPLGRCADISRAEYRLRELGHLAKGFAEKEAVEIELFSLLFSFKREGRVGNKILEEVGEFIRVHADRPLKAAEVARRFSYSADHLSRVFKRETGLGLQEYINDTRLSLIKSELLSETFSIKELAARLGFEDGNRLSKFFKYHVGKAPESYRSEFFLVHTNIK